MCSEFSTPTKEVYEDLAQALPGLVSKGEEGGEGKKKTSHKKIDLSYKLSLFARQSTEVSRPDINTQHLSAAGF